MEATCEPEMLAESIELKPGTYRMNVVAEDAASGHLTNCEVTLEVPGLDNTTPRGA